MSVSGSPQTGLQPDFASLQTSMTTAVQELVRIQNIPAITGGDALLTLLTQMQTDMRSMRQDMRQMRQDMTNLRTEVVARSQAVAANTIARAENSKLSEHSSILTPFVAYSTNAPIPGFPVTCGDIGSLRNEMVVPVLQALELPIDGNVVMRRKRLSKHVGSFEV